MTMGRSINLGKFTIAEIHSCSDNSLPLKFSLYSTSTLRIKASALIPSFANVAFSSCSVTGFFKYSIIFVEFRDQGVHHRSLRMYDPIDSLLVQFVL